MKTRDVIVFAGALFDAPLWTNRQHIAMRLVDRGWRVLYVEPRLLFWTQLLSGGSSLVRQSRGGVGGWLRRQVAPLRVRQNLWVQAQANLLPGSRRFHAVGNLNHALWNGWRVRLHAAALGFCHPTLLVYDTEAAEFLDDFPASPVVYDCVDDHRAQARADQVATLVAREEEAITRRANAIAVTTEPLRERFARLSRHVHFVPNAADIHAFLPKTVLGTVSLEPVDLARIPHPRVGVCGALDSYKLDVGLLRAVAQEHRAWHFVLVGPRGYAGRAERVEVDALEELPNIHFLGVKPALEVPGYVHGFDVAIIPYRANAYNAASFPLKFWEFMASGKPIVVSGLPALEPYRALAAVVTSPAEFAAAVQDALRDPMRGQGERVAEAQRHGWDTRVDQIERLLNG